MQPSDPASPIVRRLRVGSRFAIVLALVAAASAPALVFHGALAPRTPVGTTAAVAGLTAAPSASDPPIALASAPPATPAPTPTPTPTPTPGAGRPSKFGFAAKGMRGEVLGFVEASHVDYAMTRLDYRTVSTVAYFSLIGTAGGQLNRNDATWRIWNSSEMSRIIGKAHAAGSRVVFALQVFAWDPHSTGVARAILASAGARERLAEETAREVVRRGVDGVNVDFEPIPAGQAHQFDDFVRRLRARLDAAGPNYQMTVDVVGHFDSYDIPGLVHAGADAIYLMAYPYAGWWSRTAEAMAPFGGPGYDVKAAIAGLLRYLRPNQLIVGLPFYGHIWPTASGAPYAATTGQGSDVDYYQAIAIARAHGYGHLPAVGTAWSAFRSSDCAGCPAHWTQLYFDDATTLAAKWAYIRARHLLGTGIWTLPFDDSGGALDAALRAAFVAPGG